jgi:hypothetical protein
VASRRGAHNVSHVNGAFLSLFLLAARNDEGGSPFHQQLPKCDVRLEKSLAPTALEKQEERGGKCSSWKGCVLIQVRSPGSASRCGWGLLSDRLCFEHQIGNYDIIQT